MKKLLATLLILSITLFSFVACGDGGDGGQTDTTKIRIGYMSGPTGMGMAKLIHDNGGTAGNDKYAFTKYTDTSLAKADLLTGKIDLICLPTNEAAAYYNSQDDNSLVLAINTLNTLFVMSDANNTINTLADLEGKTIYTCKNGTPKIIIEHLLSVMKINATVSTNINGTEIATPANLAQQIIAGNVPIAVVPEPMVTQALLQIKSAVNSNISYSVDIDLNTVWSEECGSAIAMGCIVANEAFVNEHKSVINSFLTEYKASIEYIADEENADTSAEYIVESGVMAASGAAKTALSNLSDSIVYIDGAEMKSIFTSFCNAIGVTVPEAAFFYEK